MIKGRTIAAGMIACLLLVGSAFAAWEEKAPWPVEGSKPKMIKDGGALTVLPGTPDNVYAFKGGNTFDFYCYNMGTNEWVSKEFIPEKNSKNKKKGVKKGASLTTGADGLIYAAKGGGAYDFWAYDPGNGSWTQKADVPGAKGVKDGSGGVAVSYGGKDWIYFLKGSGSREFYRYDIEGNAWETMEDAPLGSGKQKPYKDGSCIAYDGADGIYVLKGNSQEFYGYSIALNEWTTLETIPQIHHGKKKTKPKGGAAMAYRSGVVYAFKGGNNNEFWTYTIGTNTWASADTLPFDQYGLTTKPARIKGGAALVYAGNDDALYAFRGNNTVEFWTYGFAFGSKASPNLMSGRVAPAGIKLAVSPNPFVRIANVSYSVAKTGRVSLRLYDVTGKAVATLVNGYVTAGSHSTLVNADKLARGIYVLKLETSNSTTTRKVVLE